MQVKVRNLNTFPYEEVYNGEKIRIEPGDCIEMDESQAVDFMGTFKPPVKDGDGNHLPQGFKMLKIERGAGAVPTATEPTTFACNACKEVFQTMASLNLHSEHSHKDATFQDDEAEAEIKRRPGRPAKAAS